MSTCRQVLWTKKNGMHNCLLYQVPTVDTALQLAPVQIGLTTQGLINTLRPVPRDAVPYQIQQSQRQVKAFSRKSGEPLARTPYCPQRAKRYKKNLENGLNGSRAEY